MTYCDDCGEKVFNGRCTNCHESLYILDQYHEQDIPLPQDDSEFMQRVDQDLRDVNRKQSLGNP